MKAAEMADQIEAQIEQLQVKLARSNKMADTAAKTVKKKTAALTKMELDRTRLHLRCKELQQEVK